jgi:hypothetical protein
MEEAAVSSDTDFPWSEEHLKTMTVLLDWNEARGEQWERDKDEKERVAREAERAEAREAEEHAAREAEEVEWVGREVREAEKAAMDVDKTEIDAERTEEEKKRERLEEMRRKILERKQRSRMVEESGERSKGVSLEGTMDTGNTKIPTNKVAATEIPVAGTTGATAKDSGMATTKVVRVYDPSDPTKSTVEVVMTRPVPELSRPKRVKKEVVDKVVREKEHEVCNVVDFLFFSN